ncbi:hypothetical protein [Chryseobacterium sp. MIQD13]|uniref:hypothetical protein n=1 Tax=Chryseobacterium sp. MIQD13 TaxID=3422310 RepID=UPI003D2E35CC
MVGIILLPMLLTYIFPKLKQYSVFVAGLLFIFWKSSYSEGFIKIYNVVSPISLHRVVDYTDLLVLLLLPFSYILIKNTRFIDHFAFRKVNPSFILLPSMFILMATSPGKRYYEYVPYTGNLYFNYSDFKINKSKDELFSELRKNNIDIQKDTVRIIALNKRRFLYSGKFEQKNLYNDEKIYHISDDSLKADIFREIKIGNQYKIGNIQLGDQTIRDIQLDLRSLDKNVTLVIIKSAKVGENLKAEEVDRKLRKMYKKMLAEKFKAL